MKGCWNQVIFKASSNTNLFMMIKILLKQIKSEWYKGTFLNHTLTQAALLVTFLGWERLNLQ